MANENTAKTDPKAIIEKAILEEACEYTLAYNKGLYLTPDCSLVVSRTHPQETMCIVHNYTHGEVRVGDVLANSMDDIAADISEWTTRLERP